MPLAHQVGTPGEFAEWLDDIEDQAKRRFNWTIGLSGDRHRLAWLHRGRPPFPGWYPHDEGGAPEAFWIDFKDRAGRTRATAGALRYLLGPANLANWINAGGMNADGHRITIEGEAAAEASAIRLEVGFSGNLWVPDDADRATDQSRWLTEIVPLLNKVIAASLWPSVESFITFVRDIQVNHLAPRYRLPILVPGVKWWQRFDGTTSLHLGVQTLDELQQSIRDQGSRSKRPRARSAA